MSALLKWLLRLLAGVLFLIFIVFVIAAFVPLSKDPPVEERGAGASNVEPSYSGLQREFPPLNEPASNPTTAEKVTLGRLLFFDPVLSQNNDIACATCHHPDLGFSDGRPTAVGPQGTILSRNTPSLWNVGYAAHLFWDGRVDSLESQVETPLMHPDEMGVENSEALVTELQAIPEYSERFTEAFGGGDDAITLENVARALAAFQRTLISDNSPFDQYAAGNFDALTPPQRRGLALFRSGATRCFECHTPPTFASDTFRVVGVDSDDPGRAAVSEEGQQGAFKVPSLRNVALSAPYMHDGSLATLADVVDFYAKGGGRAHGVENVDVFVNGFELTAQEQADLIAFLYALTDESNNVEIPESVPSGLPVVSPVENPARQQVAAQNTGALSGRPDATRDPMTITVREGESIQAAVDRAQPGDTVEVAYGVYHERVAIDINDLTLRGVANQAGEWPILDGEGQLSDGVIASGNNFTIANFHIRNYTDNGVLVEGVTGVHFHDIFAENTGTYGVYPVQSTNVLIERVEVTGVDDAGIYAGQCENVIVRDSVAYGNVLGIELENTWNGEVHDNHAYDNSVGILIVLLPQLTSKVSAHTKIYNNFVEDNNHANFAPEGAIAGVMPPGVGIALIATDNNEVYNNTIKGNKTTGVALFNLLCCGAFEESEVDVGPLPEGNLVRNNELKNNGYEPDALIKELGIPGGDILWDGSGSNNRFHEQGASSFPPVLPREGWPDFALRAYNNVLSTIIDLVT